MNTAISSFQTAIYLSLKKRTPVFHSSGLCDTEVLNLQGDSDKMQLYVLRDKEAKTQECELSRSLLIKLWIRTHDTSSTTHRNCEFPRQMTLSDVFLSLRQRPEVATLITASSAGFGSVVLGKTTVGVWRGKPLTSSQTANKEKDKKGPAHQLPLMVDQVPNLHQAPLLASLLHNRATDWGASFLHTGLGGHSRSKL